MNSSTASGLRAALPAAQAAAGAEALAHHAAHAAAHEVEFKRGGHHGHAQHGAAHDHERVALARGLRGFFQALGVFAAVAELQGVGLLWANGGSGHVGAPGWVHPIFSSYSYQKK